MRFRAGILDRLDRRPESTISFVAATKDALARMSVTTLVGAQCGAQRCERALRMRLGVCDSQCVVA